MRYVAILVLALVASCNNEATIGSQDADVSTDAKVPTDDGGAPCVTDSDCPGAHTLSGSICAYKIADGCSAKGTCMLIPSPTCASFTEFCGCNGHLVRSGSCYYATGYAGGPTTGAAASTCGDGGL